MASGDVKSKPNRVTELGAAMAVAMSAFTLYHSFIGSARAEADAGMRPMQAQIDAMAARVSNVEQGQTLVRADVHELALDVRAQYRAQMTGERQERLEKPPRDAGEP